MWGLWNATVAATVPFAAVAFAAVAVVPTVAAAAAVAIVSRSSSCSYRVLTERPVKPGLSTRPGCATPPPVINPSTSAVPSLNTINKLRVPTLQHVPKGVRDVWAGVVGETLQGILSNPANIDNWCKWFALARCVLANPMRGGRSHWGETVKTIRMRITRWRAGDFSGLWSELMNEQDRLRRRRRPKKESSMSIRAANARRARRAMEDGQFKKATQALTSNGLAQASPDVLAEMLAKHPQDVPPQTPGPSSSPDSDKRGRGEDSHKELPQWYSPWSVSTKGQPSERGCALSLTRQG